MAERRKSGKRKTAPAREAKRLSLLDLPPAAGTDVELPTNPGKVIRAPQKRTLLPAASGPIADASLESLARLAHRASGVPVDRPLGTRPLKPYLSADELLPAASAEPDRAPPSVRPSEIAARAERAALPTEPSPPPDFVRASSLPPVDSFRPSSPPAREAVRPSSFPPSELPRPSSLPPPIQMPSEPPRKRARSNGGAWLRPLGVIVLSATVGAVVSSAIWGVRSELAEAAAGRRIGFENTEKSAVLQPANCQTAAPAATVNAPLLVPSTALASVATPEAPRISFDALPRQESQPRSEDRRAAVSAEHVSLDGTGSERASRTTSDSRASRRRDTQSEARAGRERRTTAPAEPAALPDQPTRASINQAVTRAASAASSCDSGPQDGKVSVTFAPSGAVQSVGLVKGFGDAAINGCVLRAFGRARVPAFSGEPVVAKKTVAW
jgi:hypothetical protein